MKKIVVVILSISLIALSLASVYLMHSASQERGAPLMDKTQMPDYSRLFKNDTVLRIDIKVDEEEWNTMEADLVPHGTPTSPKGPRLPREEINSNRRPWPGNAPPPAPSEHPFKSNKKDINKRLTHIEGERPPFPPHAKERITRPRWSRCTVRFNDQEWHHVGLRFKGNSSLRSTIQMGLMKTPFKLDFDQFEDDFPETRDQRFYGFKQLNLKNNFLDPSFMREKLATELFSSFGLVTSKAAFCQVFIDNGEGPQYFGLYTLVEEVDDTVIKTQFKDKNGNLYKPDGIAATFSKGSFNRASMNKKSHNRSNDYADVQQLYEVLNSTLRTQNHKLWKSKLSEIFDVPAFLKWLAANNVIQNWDSYGTTFHNYYLYHNPTSNKLEWIPWDHNETFQPGKMSGALSLALTEVNDSWPLIRFIIDDAEWKMNYNQYLADFSQTIYTPEIIIPILDSYQNLIAPFVVGRNGEQEKYTFLQRDSDFYEAVESLKRHVKEQQTSVRNYINQQNF